MVGEEFIAAALAGIGDTLDELIERSPSEAVRSDLTDLVEHVDRLIDRLGEPFEAEVQAEEDVGKALP